MSAFYHKECESVYMRSELGGWLEWMGVDMG